MLRADYFGVNVSMVQIRVLGFRLILSALSEHLSNICAMTS